MTDVEYFEWLKNDGGYINAQLIPNTTTWVAYEKLLFHWSLVGGPMFDFMNVNHRYCYTDLLKLDHNFTVWKEGGFKGEPEGWHKIRGYPFSDAGSFRPVSDEEANRIIDALFAKLT